VVEKDNDISLRTEAAPLKFGIVPLLIAPTLFLSAFLLFWFEPMIGKMMLPFLGGTASIWITCLLFFQLMLLAGYGYAHLLERFFRLRGQIVVHALLMGVVFAFLPIQFSVRADGTATAHPSAWLLWELIKAVGLPFAVVSTTAPLLQNWLTKTTAGAARDPYYLYAVSNAGSLIGLLSYPLMIEPAIGVRMQSVAWLGGFALLTVLVLFAARLLWPYSETTVASPSLTTPAPDPAWRSRFFWLAAAFVPSALMSAVTNHILLNLASAPFLWIIPLALYLITFMLAFGRRIRLSSLMVSRAEPAILLLVLPFVAAGRGVDARYMWGLVGIHRVVLAIGALLCHTALASSRPSPHRLTEFYLWIALGGALGAAFTAILAPAVFETVLEYPLLVAALAFFRVAPESDSRINGGDLIWPAAIGFLVIGIAELFKWASVDITTDWTLPITANAVVVLSAYLLRRRVFRFGMSVAVLIMTYGALAPQFYGVVPFIYSARDFFGVKGVRFDFGTNSRRLLHGDTLHGLESLDEELQGQPLSYYHESGPVGDVMRVLDQRADHRIGVVGLGTGSMAGWTAPHRHITFFDIDPQMHDIARRFFTFLQRCGEKCDVVIGDGRLTIEKTRDGEFDLLMLDAFNSDSIPAHLVSREAVRMYLSKLKPDGLLMFHVSNRYMDVEGLISAVVTDASLEARIRHDEILDSPLKARSHYIVAAKTARSLGLLNHDLNWLKVEKPAEILPWTDDYSNMLEILRW
jgi:SAM-dependent methyltransferase